MRIKTSFGIGGCDHRRISLVAARSVSGIDRTSAAAAVGGARGVIFAGVVVGILDAVEIPSRRGGLTLLVAVPDAVAEARIVVALKTKRMARANGFSCPAADHRQAA